MSSIFKYPICTLTLCWLVMDKPSGRWLAFTSERSKKHLHHHLVTTMSSGLRTIYFTKGLEHFLLKLTIILLKTKLYCYPSSGSGMMQNDLYFLILGEQKKRGWSFQFQLPQHITHLSCHSWSSANRRKNGKGVKFPLWWCCCCFVQYNRCFLLKIADVICTLYVSTNNSKCIYPFLYWNTESNA